jgi:hypothetical protein
VTCNINLIVVVKVVNLDTSCIYSCKHMVGMDKISSSECGPSITRHSTSILGMYVN